MATNGAQLKAALMSETKSGAYVQVLRAADAKMGLDGHRITGNNTCGE